MNSLLYNKGTQAESPIAVTWDSHISIILGDLQGWSGGVWWRDDVMTSHDDVISDAMAS